MISRANKEEQNKLFVGRFNILPDLMSFPSMWRVWRWISSCFSRSLKSHSALKSTLHSFISSATKVFSSVAELDAVWDGPAPPRVGRSPLFLSISWSVLLYLGGRGWYLHPLSLPLLSLPPSLPPPPPDTMWTDVLPVPFFPVPLRPVGAAAASPCAEPFLHHLLKSKPRRLARTAGILALIKLHYC